MSAYDYDDDQQEQDQSPRALRENRDKLAKELKAAREQNEKLMKQVAEQSLANILNAKNVPARMARYIKADGVEASEAAVEKWLAENGSDFGYQPGAQEVSGGATPEEAPAQGQAQAPAPQSALTDEVIQGLMQMYEAFGGASAAPVMPLDQQKAAVDSVASQVSTGFQATDYKEAVRKLAEAGIPMGGDIKY